MGGTHSPSRATHACEQSRPTTRAPTWRSCLPLRQGREGAVAGVVGGRLVVAGGYGGDDLTSVEAYTPTGWIPLPPLPHATSGSTACVLNGRLYVMGGGLAQATSAGAGDVRGKWTFVDRESRPARRARASSSAVVDGKLAPWRERRGLPGNGSVFMYDPGRSWTTGRNSRSLWGPAALRCTMATSTSSVSTTLIYRGSAWLWIPGGQKPHGPVPPSRLSTARAPNRRAATQRTRVRAN